MRTSVGIALRFCVVCLAFAAAVIAAEPEAVSKSPFGVGCPWPGMEKAGIRWCRVGAGATSFANWPDIQPSADVWDWSRSDSELKNALDSQGVSVLPILGYTPLWASRAPEGSAAASDVPKDIGAYARFARECVSRYKGRIKVWEVWNEPQVGFLRGSAAEYAEMVRAVCVAAKQADPECRIAMGCAGVDTDFLARLYEFGCGPYFDIMSVHPYQWGKELNDGWMREKLEGCRALMDRHGDQGKEIWITEQGWSMAEGVNAEEQADLLIQAMVTALSLRDRLKIEKYFWFCVKDWGSPGFGLFDVDGKPKPAFHAYGAVTTELSNARYRGTVKTPEETRCHVFDEAGKPVVALWAVSTMAKVPIEWNTSAETLTIRSVENQTSTIKPAQGKVTIEATHRPVFVRGLKASELGIVEAQPAPAAETTPQVEPFRDVWVSVMPQAKTARPFVCMGSDGEVPFTIHNDQTHPAQGTLRVDVQFKDRSLAKGEVAFDAAPGKTQVVAWRPAISPEDGLDGELGMLRVRGNCGSRELTPIDVPVRLAKGRVVEFIANSWLDEQYVYKAERSGGSDSVRFGGEFGYRFELGDAKSGQLRMNVGANAANEWNVSLSMDDKEYVVERSGKSWPSWQTISLDKYLAGREGNKTVYVKIHGNDCQVREVILQAGNHASP